MSIGVNIYALSVIDGDANYRELHDVYDGKSIINLIKGYIEDNFDNYKDDEKKSSVNKFVDWNIVQINNEYGDRYMNYLYGRIKSGAYGVESEIVDRTTGTTTHKQTEDEANLLPFDFFVALPADECNQCVMIMQTQGIYGIKGVFSDGLSKFIKEKEIKLGVQFGSLYPKQYVEKYLKDGILKKMKIFRYNIPRDEADAYGVNMGNKKVRQVISVSSALGFSESKIQQIKECIAGRRHYSTLVEINDMEIDDLKIEFNFGGKSKTISLKNIEKVVVSEDITEKVETTGGNPIKESILPIFKEISVDYLIEMGILIEQDKLQEKEIESCQSISEEDNYVEVSAGSGQ